MCNHPLRNAASTSHINERWVVRGPKAPAVTGISLGTGPGSLWLTGAEGIYGNSPTFAIITDP